jgi:hypothetical protein
VRCEQEREVGVGETLRRQRGRGRQLRGLIAASTSALPERLDTERLPCLTTGTPQAAVSSGGAGGEVEAAGAVAAGADDVDRAGHRQIGPHRQLAHAVERSHAPPRHALPWRASAASSAPASAGSISPLPSAPSIAAALVLAERISGQQSLEAMAWIE